MRARSTTTMLFPGANYTRVMTSGATAEAEGFAITLPGDNHPLPVLAELAGGSAPSELELSIRREMEPLQSQIDTQMALLLASVGLLGVSGATFGVGIWADTDERAFPPDGDKPLAYSMLAISGAMLLGSLVTGIASLFFGVSDAGRAWLTLRSLLLSDGEANAAIARMDEHNREVRARCGE